MFVGFLATWSSIPPTLKARSWLVQSLLRMNRPTRVRLEDTHMINLFSLPQTACVLVLVGCLAHASAAEPAVRPAAATTESGLASYYADPYHGRPTASGERFNMHELTAAHPRLKFGTMVRVTNTVNRRAVLVRINDRGPFVAGRVIDVSLAAAEELQMVQSGLATVTLEVVSK